mgnify:CR=1 FL=1
MSMAQSGQASRREPASFRPNGALVLAAAAILLTALHYAGLLPAALHRLPETLVPDFASRLDAVFDFVKDDLHLLAVTRWMTTYLEWLLDVTANLLYGKRRWPNIGPLPWTAIAASAMVLGYHLGGWRLAVLAGITFTWTALVGQWDIAMETMSVLVITVPSAFAIGLILGIAAWRYPAFEQAIKPLLSILQTLPFFTYLLPAVIFFKVGPTAGAVATTIYAIPPMVLMTTLGLKKVSPEIVEAGHMSGCTRYQLLRHVYLPSARAEILIGVNQVIMLCLAMVVLTAFIGMPGLGAKLLSMMGSFKLGRSFEIGVTIVLLAVTLDRLSKAWVARQPRHFDKGTPFWRRRLVLLVGGGAFCLFCVIGQVYEPASEISRRNSLSLGAEIDVVIKAALEIEWVKAVTAALRAFLNVQVLIPFRNFLLSLPTPALVLGLSAIAWRLGGVRQAAIVALFFSLVALSGWWDRSVITLYSVISSVALALLIGIPIAVLASRSKAWSTRALLVCDTAQTFPSFVYLIPAIMLFGITDVAVIISILIFAMVPVVRYTIEGLNSVPPEVMEAADMSGATRLQKLAKVQMPLALPTMAVGLNQAVMFAFFMVIIAAFIGTQDLGQEMQRTLAGTDLGKNFVLGICVVLMAQSFDLTIREWASRKRKLLGLN